MTDVALFAGLGAAMVLASASWLLRPVLAHAGRGRVARAHRATVILVALGLPASVAAIYAQLGRPDLLAPLPDPVRTMAEERTVALALRLASTPDDVAGLRLLARSYEALRAFPDAVAIRERLVALSPGDPDALVDLADACSMAQAGSPVGEPVALARRALAIDPDHDRALATVALDAVERDDLPTAIAAWRRIASRAEPGSALARSLAADIDGARRTLDDAARRRPRGP